MRGLLEARLSVNYPNKPGVLRDVRLEVREGEMVGLVGESGSGKSTIALALLRLLEHKGASIQGQILFKGRECAASLSRAVLRVLGLDITSKKYVCSGHFPR